MSSAEISSLVRRWLWPAMLGVLLGVVAAAAITAQLPRVYSASTKLLVTAGDSGVLTGGGNLTADQVLTTYAEVLKSRPVVDATFADVGLALPYETAAQNVDAAPLRGTQIIVLSARASDPDTAAKLANQLVVAAVQQARTVQAGQAAARRAQVTDVANQLAAEVANRARQLEQLRGQPGGTVNDAAQAASQAALADAEQRYAAAVRSVSEQDLAATRNGDPLSTVEPAVPPLTPSSPRLALNLALGGLFGLVLAVALATAVELRRDRITLPDTLRRRLGLPVFGVIPRVHALAAATTLVDSPAALEAFRRLRTTLRLAVDRRPSTILVVGAHPGAGASTVASGLATAWARAGEQVVLVSPAASAVSHAPSLEDVHTALQPTPVDRLRLLPANLSSPRRTASLLTMLHGLAERVVVDAASPSLVPHVEAVVLVVDARSTRGRDTKQKARALAAARVLGTVLNQAEAVSAQAAKHPTTESSAARAGAQPVKGLR